MSEALDREAIEHLAAAEDALARLRAVLTRGQSEVAPAPEPPQSQPVPAADARAAGLTDPAAFFAAIRNSKALGPTLTTEEVSGCEVIIATCTGFPFSWAAYCLATAAHETAFTMQPIKERGGAGYFTRMYDIQGERPAKARELGNLQPGDGARYCGRGYVQLTGRANYAKASDKVGVDFVSDPDLVMQPEYAAAVMKRGMQEGWFTGKSLATYLPAVADIHQFANCRRVINGLDRAVEIAGYALEFQAALQAGGWK